MELIIGIPITIIFMIIPDVLLKMVYDTNLGVNYVRWLAPLFLAFYIQGPLTSCLQAMGKAKCAMNGTLIGSFIRIGILVGISYLKVGILGLVMATVGNMLFVTGHHLYHVYKYLRVK